MRGKFNLGFQFQYFDGLIYWSVGLFKCPVLHTRDISLENVLGRWSSNHDRFRIMIFFITLMIALHYS